MMNYRTVIKPERL